MKMNDAYPKKYACAADLKGAPQMRTIRAVSMEEVGNQGEVKPVLHFQDGKAMVMNGRAIAEKYGDDFDGWAGKPIVLFPTIVSFQGKTMEAIRVRVPDIAPRKGSKRPTSEVISDDLPEDM
jgi:hypothetical protein